jgi:hypothetical protein
MKDLTKRSYLVDGDIVPISPALACTFGINHAAFLQQLHFLLTSVRVAGRDYNFDGTDWWVYYSYPQWLDHLPWLTLSTLRRVIAALEEQAIVRTRTNPHNNIDHTKWYRIDYDALSRTVAESSRVKLNTRSAQNEQGGLSKMGRSNGSKRADLYKESITSTNNDSKKTNELRAGSAPSRKSSKTSTRPTSNGAQVDQAKQAKDTGIVAIIKAWKDATGDLNPNAYANKTWRAGAAAMMDAGLSPTDVADYVHDLTTNDDFWGGRTVPFMHVVSNIVAWRRANPEYRTPGAAVDDSAEAAEQPEDNEPLTADDIAALRSSIPNATKSLNDVLEHGLKAKVIR